MIVLSGADLFTSNIMFMTTSYLHRRVSLVDVLINWTLTFIGNLAGMLFFALVIIGYGGVFDETPTYTSAAITIAVDKAVKPGWYQVFLRAIGANWLVSFAVFISISSREIVSKIVAIWWPTATFVALALDHVVANMFFIPLAIFLGGPITTGYYIWKSLIPAALGNMVGGGLFVGAMYWYLYLTGEGGVSVSFDIGSLDTAMEAGGPMRRSQRDGEGEVIKGLNPERELPHSGSNLKSGIAMDLSDESPYTKSHTERTRGMESSSDEKV